MKTMGLNELREAYLSFFESKQHLRMPSFSLVPKDDKGLLLINAGMAPLKPYFTGLKTPPSKRVTTCQKCVRTIDIDNVGYTSRHATLFEMLGNFSFGDYFTKEIIPWAWEFVTEVLQIPKDKLYVTIHLNDDEAYEIWTTKTDVDPKRIFRLGADNFWEIGVGPCGPCSEIHYDKGAGKITTSEEFEKASDADKIVEFWNLVFTQFDKDEEGNYNKLAHPNIDTGMGLERIATIMQGVESIFDIDTVKSIVEGVTDVAKIPYGKDKTSDISIRIIADHIKAVAFLIGDDVLPSNEGRGYVLRRLLRRAARHGRLLGILSGEKAFKLYDTYGFPLELTEEIAKEENIKVDLDGFKKEMELQKKRAREAREENTYMGGEDSIANKISEDIKTVFTGYSETESKGIVKAIISEDSFVNSVNEGEAIVVTDKTPFYAEMGGQIGDTGMIFRAEVVDCKKNINGKIMHFVRVLEGTLNLDEEVTLTVNSKRRNSICKNHSATHMLHEALKEVLGSHVNQSGSYVNEERLRFDFTHFAALTEEELEKVELLVNEKIMTVSVVDTKEMSLDEARNSGATCLFDEKYAEKVRVVSVGDFSKELCGGTHVANSGEIGLFKIVSESGVAAGIRRIEAVTGISALKFMELKNNMLKEAASMLKCNEKDIAKRIAAQAHELKEKDKEIAELKAKLVQGAEDDILKDKVEINGVELVTAELKDVDGNSLRDLADKVRNKLNNGIVVLASDNGGKVNLVAMATKNSLANGVHCGKVIKEVAAVVGGGGGGRPDMAQAGGKNPENIAKALEKAKEVVELLVK